MEIKSMVLGPQSIDEEQIISFPNGIPGFEKDTRFKLFHQEDNAVIYWLQSLDNAEVTFSVAEPMQFNINYNFALTSDEETQLKIENSDDLLVMIILHKNENDSGVPMIKGSINSPLVINTQDRIGLQKNLVKVEQSIMLTESSNLIDVSEAS